MLQFDKPAKMKQKEIGEKLIYLTG